MKKILYFITCATVAAVSLIACNPEEKKDKPDGVAAIESFTLTKAANDFLDIDLKAVIDNDTIRIPAPKKDDAPFDTVYVPAIKLTKGDVLTVVDTLDNASAYEEGFSFKLSDRVSFVVSDETVTPAVTKRYGIAFLDNDRKATLTQFVFAKEDNSDLEEDCAMNDFATSTLSVSLPKAANGKALVATVAASINDEITVNKQVVGAEGKVTIDTAFPVDITVKDLVTGESTSYVVKFSKQSGDIISVEKVGTFKPENLQGWVTMAIDGDTPYVGYYAGPAAATRYAYVAKFENGNFTQIGGAISERTNAVYVDALNGKLYVMYMDYTASTATTATNAQTFTVKTWNGTDWDLVGTRGTANIKASGLGNYKHAFIADPTSNKLFTACISAAAVESAGIAKYGLILGTYDGSAWSTVQHATDKTMVLSPRFARSSNAIYMVYARNGAKRFDLKKFSNGSWSDVAMDFNLGGDEVGTYCVSLTCDNNGDVYFVNPSNATGNWLGLITKFVDGKPVKAYNAIPGETFNNSSALFKCAFDKNNNPVVAVVTESKQLKVVVEDPDTKTWASGLLAENAVTGGILDMAKDSKGNVYIAAVGTEGGNAINLYKVSYK